jgi:hypothetical protein
VTKNGSLKVLKLIAVLLTLATSPAARSQAPRPVPPTTQLQPGQTLEDLAEKYFDDPSAADEIRALNHIPAGAQPKPDTTLQLPGKERDQALIVLRVATQALQQAKADGAEEYAPRQLEKTKESLQAAEAARKRAAYQDCRRLADETWALARLARKESLARRPKKNRFAVSVDKKGTTRVEVIEGDGVKVTAGKKSTTVKRGYAVRVKPGKEPEKARQQLPPPQPVLPNNGSILVTSSIYFSWKPVEGASRYVLLISKDEAGIQPVRQVTTANTSYLFRSSLPDGIYHWFARTVDSQGLVGRASSSRQFTLRASSDGGVTVESVPPKPQDEGK